MGGQPRNGRDDGFTEFVVARRALLYRTAYLLCGDSHRAEDVVQVALAKLYVAWPRVSRMDSVEAYARRTVVNAHLDETRRPWRRERPGARRPSSTGRWTARTAASESDDTLWQALRALAPGQRRVVVLRHYWGLSVEETARDLGVTTGTVKSQSSAALARLRAALIPVTNGEAR